MDIIKRIGTHLLFALGDFIIAFFGLSALSIFLGELNVVQFKYGIIVSIILSAIFSLLSVISTNRKEKKVSRLKNWIALNQSGLTFFYCLVIFALASIKSKVMWSYSDLKAIITVEWAILDISITVFLVWKVLIMQYLKDTKPKLRDNTCLINIVLNYEDKLSYYQQADHTFLAVSFLSVNIILLITATAFVLISFQKVTLLNQTTVIICFYFCTNTLALLFFDIIKPLKQEKGNILSTFKVSFDEAKSQQTLKREISQLPSKFREIDQLESIDEMQKCAIKAEMLYNISGDPQLKQLLDELKVTP